MKHVVLIFTYIFVVIVTLGICFLSLVIPAKFNFSETWTTIFAILGYGLSMTFVFWSNHTFLVKMIDRSM